MPSAHCPCHSLHSSHSIQRLENAPGLLLPQHLHRDGFLSLSHAPSRSAWLRPSPPHILSFVTSTLVTLLTIRLAPTKTTHFCFLISSPLDTSACNVVYISLPQIFHWSSHSARMLAKRPEILLHIFLLFIDTVSDSCGDEYSIPARQMCEFSTSFLSALFTSYPIHSCLRGQLVCKLHECPSSPPCSAPS